MAENPPPEDKIGTQSERRGKSEEIPPIERGGQPSPKPPDRPPAPPKEKS
jgi:hypothetical protein